MSDSELHPFGPGSHAPFEDIHQMPECHPIKGNADSMKYHRPDSHSYKVTGAEVWFTSPSVAEAAGFVLAGSHPKFSSSADFEPGSSGHPCSAADVDAILGGGSSGGSSGGSAASSGGDMRETVTMAAGAGGVAAGGAAAVAGAAGGGGEADADMHPFGPGSHAPLADANEMPACYPIKGNVDSMKFHRPDSQNYGATVAEMWFTSPSVAEAAGFELATASHPKDSSSADYEPGGSGHPCTVAEVDAILAGGSGSGSGSGSDADADAGASVGAGVAAAAGAAGLAGAAMAGGVGDDTVDMADGASGDVRQTLGATGGAAAGATAGDVRDTVVVDAGSGDGGGGDDASTGFAEGDEPFGPGSHAPLSDVHEMPECHPIKGNADSMKYHRPDSSGYEQTKAEVWFVSPSVAEAAGFVLAGSHPEGASSADFEPGGTGHPCSAAQVDGLGLGSLLLAGGAVAGGAAMLADDHDVTEDDITQDVGVAEVAAEEVVVEDDVFDREVGTETTELDIDVDEDRTIDSSTLGVAAAGAGVVGAAALLGGGDDGDDEVVEIEEIEAEVAEVELPEVELAEVEPVEEIGDITVESVGRETVEIEVDDDDGPGIGMGVAAAAGAAAVGAAALLGGDDDEVEIDDVDDVTVDAGARKVVAEVEAVDSDVTRPAAVAAGAATVGAGAAATRRVRDDGRKAVAAGDGGGAAAYTKGASGGFGWGWLKWLLPLLLLAALLALLFWACSGDDEVAAPIVDVDPTSTAVPDPTATDVPEPTATPIPEPTATPVPEPTATPTPDPTATPTPEPEPTATPEPEPDPLYSRLAAAGYATLNEAVSSGVITFAGDTATFTDADTATMQAICDLIDGESLDQLQPIQWQSSGDDAVDADRATAIDDFIANCNGSAGIALDALAPTPKFTG